MYQYMLGALVAFALFGMGLTAAILGLINYIENKKSQAGSLMLKICVCVFFWDFGYAWMSLCYDSDYAYLARAIALLAITFYMIFILKYVAEVTDYPQKRLKAFLWIFAIVSLLAWLRIIGKDAVTFELTPWGYWYYSKLTFARFVQFASILAALVQYYHILRIGWKKMKNRRQKSVLVHFSWFGVIFFLGYVVDTLCPMVLNSHAIPGSAISAFVSAMVLFFISKDNKIFGLNQANVSEYVFRDVSMPVMITDNQGKIVLFNDSTKEYLRCPDSGLVRNVMDAFFEPYEKDLVKVKRTDKICRLNKTDVRDRYDDLLYSIYFVQDVTETRKSYQMLQESQRIAEKANRAKSEFLANMSHEIRTPINAVLGMDEMILRESDDPTVLEYAGNIKQAGNILLSLINDILDFSKIESGKMDIISKEYEISSLLNDLYSMSENMATKKGLKLLLNIDSNIPSKLWGDDMRIKQIITNLLTNAVKYTHEGSITFAVTVSRKNEKEVYLRVSVKDTGIGIRKEDQNKLFSAFQRVNESVNRDIEGTGLGLNITVSLLKMMGSELKLESTYGKGSEFYFVLRQPIVDETPIGNFNDVIVAGTREREKYLESFHAPDARILVVDDNEMNLQVICGLLKKTEVQVVTAISGQESISLVKQQKFDVIFMDHMMPEMDGIETVKRMKLLSDNPSKDAPIIAFTANAVAGARELFLQNGFDDFLSKPVVGKDLERMLIKYLPPRLLQEGEKKEEIEVWEQEVTEKKEYGIGGRTAKTSHTVKTSHTAKTSCTKERPLPYQSKKINVREGLGYCANDEELYREILELFVTENKTKQLERTFESKDYENYRILVHALIAMAKNIGAMDFSEFARRMDMAAADGEIDFLKQHHANFLNAYREILAELI